MLFRRRLQKRKRWLLSMRVFHIRALLQLLRLVRLFLVAVAVPLEEPLQVGRRLLRRVALVDHLLAHPVAVSAERSASAVFRMSLWMTFFKARMSRLRSQTRLHCGRRRLQLLRQLEPLLPQPPQRLLLFPKAPRHMAPRRPGLLLRRVR
jgi:hypothetical protein